MNYRESGRWLTASSKSAWLTRWSLWSQVATKTVKCAALILSCEAVTWHLGWVLGWLSLLCTTELHTALPSTADFYLSQRMGPINFSYHPKLPGHVMQCVCFQLAEWRWPFSLMKLTSSKLLNCRNSISVTHVSEVMDLLGTGLWALWSWGLGWAQVLYHISCPC